MAEMLMMHGMTQCMQLYKENDGYSLYYIHHRDIKRQVLIIADMDSEILFV